MSHEGIRFVTEEVARRASAAEKELPREAIDPQHVRVQSAKARASILTGKTATRAIGVLPGCAMPAPAPPATKNASSRIASQEPKPKPANLLPMYKAAGAAQQRSLPSVAMPSASTGTMATTAAFIPGSICAAYAIARRVNTNPAC